MERLEIWSMWRFCHIFYSFSVWKRGEETGNLAGFLGFSFCFLGMFCFLTGFSSFLFFDEWKTAVEKEKKVE